MLIIFDWDGTLIDSADKIVGAMQSAAAKCDLPHPEADAVRNIIGLGLREGVRLIFPRMTESEEDRAIAAYSEAFVTADAKPCQFFPYVDEVLAELRAAGHQLAVATGKSRRGLNRVFGNLAMHDQFIASRCADETASKPDPLMLQQLLAETGIVPEDAVMVGDTEYDLEMASRAGIASVGVSYGAHAPERLQKWSPLAILDCFSELPEIIARHGG